MRLPNRRWRDLRRTRVEGVYVLDMIAHNNDRQRDVFQMCPGAGTAVAMAGRTGRSRQRGLERFGALLESPLLAAAAVDAAAARRGDLARGRPPSPTTRRDTPHRRTAKHTLQHRRADLLRRRRAGGSLHGELRHQSTRVSRQPGHHGQHRLGLRRSRGGDCSRVGRPRGNGRESRRREWGDGNPVDFCPAAPQLANRSCVPVLRSKDNDAKGPRRQRTAGPVATLRHRQAIKDSRRYAGPIRSPPRTLTQAEKPCHRPNILLVESNFELALPGHPWNRFVVDDRLNYLFERGENPASETRFEAVERQGGIETGTQLVSAHAGRPNLPIVAASRFDGRQTRTARGAHSRRRLAR